MKLGKFFSLTLAAAGLIVFGSACGIFETSGEDTEKDPFYRALNGKDKPDVKDPAAESGDAKLKGGATEDLNSPGASQDGSGLAADYDGFGRVLKDVKFQSVYFKFDQSRIDSAELAKLDEVANHLKNNPKHGVVIEGNCDARGTQEYNLALGERRARAAYDYMVRLGVPADQLEMISFGKERPAVMGSGEKVWAQNRRDEFNVIAR